MSKKIRIKAKSKDGVADIKCLIKHPMETGILKDKKTGKLIPAYFIQKLIVSINDNIIVDGDVNTTVSRNPYFRFKAKAKKGDVVKVSWLDNKDDKGSFSTKVR